MGGVLWERVCATLWWESRLKQPSDRSHHTPVARLSLAINQYCTSQWRNWITGRVSPRSRGLARRWRWNKKTSCYAPKWREYAVLYRDCVACVLLNYNKVPNVLARRSSWIALFSTIMHHGICIPCCTVRDRQSRQKTLVIYFRLKCTNNTSLILRICGSWPILKLGFIP